jgi:signal transduction histidine kinase
MKMPDLAQTDEEQVIIQVGQDLIHLVSHQLLNSASSLQLICELWKDPDSLSVAHRAETLHVLQHEVDFLHRLGRYILQLDRTNNSELLLNLKAVDMVDLVTQMLPSFKLQGLHREFESNYEADLPLVWGDAERLQDVLNNLVSNALKYSTPFSPITLSIHRENNNQVMVSVTNSGPTIPVGDEEKIFTRFYRGQGHQQQGYGLGLYLAHRLVKQHGGRIWVESPSAGVTAFYFTLLLADQEQLIPNFRGSPDLMKLSKGNGTINLNDHPGTSGTGRVS